MVIISFLQGLVFYGPIATLYRLDRGISLSDIFILQIVLGIVSLILEIPWGWVADIIGYKRTLLISNVLFFASKVVFYFADGFLLFALEALFAAMAISGLSGCDSAFIYISSKEYESGKNFGAYSAASTAGYVLAALSGGFIAAYSYSLNVLLTAVAYFAAMALTFFLTEVHGTENNKTRIKFSDISSVFSDKITLTEVLAFSLVGQSGQALVFLHQPKFISAGINTGDIGIITALTQMICMLAIKSYSFANKIGEMTLLFAATAIVSFGFMVLAYSDNGLAAILSFVLINGAIAFQWPVMEVIKNRAVKTDNRATILSVYALFYSVIGIALNLILSEITFLPLSYSFILLAMLASISTVVFIAIGMLR